MIARIDPNVYDVAGRSVFRPDLRKHCFKPTFPFGRYFSRPLTVRCESLRDVRRFLSNCRGMEDAAQFGVEEYWQPPDEFEQRRQGDCEDYSLWTWRQLLAMGFNARLVLGRVGRYGEGHAWVTFEHEGNHYLVEPQRWHLGDRLPTLSTLRYVPEFSIEWDGNKAHWYRHKKPEYQMFSEIPGLLLEWVLIWGKFWARALPRLPAALFKRVSRRTS